MNQMPTREEIQMAMQNIPAPAPSTSTSPNNSRKNTSGMAMQNMPTPTAPVSSMPKFNLPQMQSKRQFGLPQSLICQNRATNRRTNIDV
jgi:hypothetical protein